LVMMENISNTNVGEITYTTVLFIFAFDGLLFFQADNGLILSIPVTEIANRAVGSEMPAVLVEPWIGNAMKTLQLICRDVGPVN